MAAPCRFNFIFAAALCCPWLCATQQQVPSVETLEGFLTAVRLAVDVPTSELADARSDWRPLTKGPKVAPQWSANVTYNSNLIGMNITDGRGVFAYDRFGQRYRTTTKAKDELFSPHGTMFMDQLAENSTRGPSSNMTSGEGKNGVCMPFPSPFFDLFAWTELATYNGSKVVHGETCNVWRFARDTAVMGKRSTVSFSACLASDGLPHEFEQNVSSAGFYGSMKYGFLSARLGDPGEEAFQPSEACATNYPAKPCEDSGTVTFRNLYRVWAPPEPRELRDRNAGDPMGDLSFLCTQAAGAAYRSKLVTLWEVEVSTAYGQYSPCNFDGHHNRCVGPPQMVGRTGRRSSQMQGNREAGGQCTNNDDIGSQYSFPHEAECKAGEKPSATGCGWGSARALRTVTVGCLVEQGLLEACGAEFGHAPFKRSVQIFTSAFKNETSPGACPEVGPGVEIMV